MVHSKFFFYVFLMWLAFGISNFLFLLVVLELLSWVFSRVLPSFLALKYLLVQSYFVFFMIMVLLVVPSACGMVFILKMGLPPIHLWFFILSLGMTGWVFLFFSTFHKLVSMVFMSKVLAPFSVVLMILYGVSSVLLFQLALFYYIVFCSSLVHRGWMLFSICVSFYLFFVYFLVYMRVLCCLLIRLDAFKLVTVGVSQSSFTSFVWLVLSGIPPLSFFWLKALVVIFLLGRFYGFYSVLVIGFAVLALASYFRGFHLRLELGNVGFYSVFLFFRVWSIFFFC